MFDDLFSIRVRGFIFVKPEEIRWHALLILELKSHANKRGGG